MWLNVCFFVGPLSLNIFVQDHVKKKVKSSRDEMLTEVNEICDDLQYLTLSEQRCGSCCEFRFLQVHRLRQIIGCLLGARATNLLDHMSAACQTQSQCSNRTELCRTGKQTHCASTYVSSH